MRKTRKRVRRGHILTVKKKKKEKNLVFVMCENVFGVSFIVSFHTPSKIRFEKREKTRDGAPKGGFLYGFGCAFKLCVVVVVEFKCSPVRLDQLRPSQPLISRGEPHSQHIREFLAESKKKRKI